MAEDKKANNDVSNVEAAIQEILAETAGPEAGEETVEEISEDEIVALISERDEMRDKFMRALADAENTRKRSERDRREAEQYGGTKLARDMLPVYDNLNRALETVGDELREQASGLVEGVELTMRALLGIFEKHGIRILKPEIGDAFDPQFHEAMFEAPVPNTKAGQIIQVMSEGFILHDRLLRPAQVGVSSNPG